MPEGTRWADYEYFPARFVREVLGGDPWEKQEFILNSIQVNKRVAVRSSHAIGKCVAGRELITLSDGRRVRADQLVGQVFEVATLNDAGALVQCAARAEWNAIEPVYELVTQSGKRVIRNGQHPLYVAERDAPRDGRHPAVHSMGFMPLSSLRPGMLVAVIDELSVFGNAVDRQPEHEIKLMALLLGDGGYSPSSSGLDFTQMDGPVLDEFRRCVALMDCKLLRYSKYRYGVSRLKRNNQKNNIQLLLERHSMYPCHSRDKRVPEAVFSLPADQLVVFLSYLFATDGWAYTGKRPASTGCKKGDAVEIGFCSASEGLVDDVIYLLQKIGIHANKSSKPNVRAWTCYIHEKTECVKFCERVGIFGKEEAVRRVYEMAIPYARRVCEHARTASPARTRWQYRHAHPGTRWEKIVSITELPPDPTVAIMVPGPETYVTQFYEHNSRLAAWAVIWYLLTRKNSIVISTAPTYTQVKNILWREVRAAWKNSLQPLWDGLEPFAESIDLGPEWYARGISTNEPERFAGYHAASGNVFMVFDEASGISQQIFNAAEGSLASAGSRLLLIGNPTQMSGEFFDAFHGTGDRSGLYFKIHVSAFDTPNLQGNGVVRPYLVTEDWVEEKRRQWGEESPLWYSRVLGDFPQQGDDALVALAWIEQAQERAGHADEAVMLNGVLRPPLKKPVNVLGVDVARFGTDSSVIAHRLNHRLRVRATIKHHDTMAVAGAVMAAQAETGATHIYVDVIGIGAGVVDRLRENKRDGLLPSQVKIHDVNVGAASKKPSKFLNLRAEYYWGLREGLKDGTLDLDLVTGVDDDVPNQLASLKYEYDGKGRIKMESKESMKERGIPSPDHADALMLASIDPSSSGLLFGLATTPN